MKAKFVEKEWGHEIWLANNEKENYCGKILHINQGHTSSMHFHMEKHETLRYRWNTTSYINRYRAGQRAPPYGTRRMYI